MSADAQQQSVAAKSGKRKMSAGEKLFDFVIYGPVNFFGTLLLTVPIAYSLERGIGKGLFQWGVNKLMGMNLNRAVAKDIMRTTTLMQGGNLMLIPVKWAEHRKVGIVKKLNEWLGDKTDPASIEEAPKQSWGSLLMGRLVAWATVFVSMRTANHFFEEKMGKFETSFGEGTAQFFKKPIYKNNQAPTELLAQHKQLRGQIEAMPKALDAQGKQLRHSLINQRELIGEQIAEKETRTYGYGKLLSWDIFATAAATVLLYLGSRLFVGKGEKKDAPAKREIAVKASDAPLEKVKEETTPEQGKDKSFTERVAESREHAEQQRPIA